MGTTSHHFTKPIPLRALLHTSQWPPQVVPSTISSSARTTPCWVLSSHRHLHSRWPGIERPMVSGIGSTKADNGRTSERSTLIAYSIHHRTVVRYVCLFVASNLVLSSLLVEISLAL